MITPNGTVTTIAGTGETGLDNDEGSYATFWYPNGIVADSHGNLFVSDTINNCIRKISPDRIVSTFAGSSLIGSDDGYFRNASFYYPSSIAIDSANNIYVADAFNNLIRKVDPLRNVTTIAGTGEAGYLDGDSSIAQFNHPEGVACDANGNVFVADSQNNMIRVVFSSGQVSSIAGNQIEGHADGLGNVASFFYPGALSLNRDGVLYISDYYNCMIRQLSI